MAKTLPASTNALPIFAPPAAPPTVHTCYKVDGPYDVAPAAAEPALDAVLAAEPALDVALAAEPALDAVLAAV